MFKIKTLIELFDKSQIENVIAGLRFKPKKIVFVGFKEVMTKNRQKALTDFFAAREYDIEFEFEIVGRYDFDAIVEKLNVILDRNEDCYFDLTGGKELVLTAMGAVSAVRDVPMFQINVKTGELIKIKKCDALPETEKSTMLLKENVALNGCGIVYGEKEDFSWELTEDFKRDLETMWNISQKKCGLWNRQSGALARFEKFGEFDEELRVNVNLDNMRACKQEVFVDESIMNELVQNNLLLEYVHKEDLLSFRYKNLQVHQCILKAGNILELYAYMLFKEIAEEEQGYYDDIDIGVNIDWDGVVHDISSPEKDTKNEIDIMLMRDLVPIFVSCKNGEVHKEALYELETVSKKIGGKYVKKFLLSTYVSSGEESRKYIKQRAHDMNITIIKGVEQLDRNEFKALLKKRVK